MASNEHIEIRKGQGAQSTISNRFEKLRYVQEHVEGIDDFESVVERTRFIDVFPKKILTRNNSPDVPFNLSINPYQGCEHGCVYCYARPSHEYWGYNASIDFERTILVKKKAAELLKQAFAKKTYRPEIICLSGNTDCYQPCERKYTITRQLLEVFAECNHPVDIITKNHLILRDLDILSEMARKNLVRVTLSITSADESLRRVLEPRTSSLVQRWKTVRELSETGIPVHVNLAPIIPALNSDAVPNLVEQCATHGARSASYLMVRLNGPIADIFEEWLRKAYPERADKVLNLIKETHGGKLNDSDWSTRMKGAGVYAEQIKQLFKIAYKKHLPPYQRVELDFSQFKRPNKNGQLDLFST